MPVSYTCPNPDCGVTLKTPNRVAAGKSVKCPKCGKLFVPETAEAVAGPGTYGLAGDDPTKKPAPAKPETNTGYKKPSEDLDDEDAESIKRGYGIIKESEEELQQAAKNKPKFTEIQEKFKKSARGPAQKLLVMPSNLLVFEGIVTVIGGLVLFIVGMWPLVFNDAPPGEEELEEAVATMLIGVLVFGWGAMVCFGASQMQELGSYPLAMTGAIMGLVPFLAGLYGLIMLFNPKVKAGFEEVAGAIDEDEEDEGGQAKDDDDDDDDDEDDESSPGQTAKKVAGKRAKKAGRRLPGEEDEDDNEEEDEEDTPKSRRRKRLNDDD